MARRSGGKSLMGIPHMDITEILDPDAVLIVGRENISNKEYSRSSIEGKRCKARRGRKDVELCEPLNFKVLQDELKTELPTAPLHVFTFQEKIRMLQERVDNLRERSDRIKIKKIAKEIPEVSNEDHIALSRLRTDTSITNSLRELIRCPTMTEVIFSAAHSNLNHVIKERHEDPGITKRKRIDISVGVAENQWSEHNLYKRFLADVELESYKLAAGANHYKHEQMPRSTDPTKVPLLQGPQNHSTPNLFHRNVAESYSYDNPGGVMSLIPEHEIILTFSIYHGVRGHKIAEFDMISRQTLKELGDAFHCPSEIHPVQQDLGLKGSCFMLNGQLFPDYRNNACDYAGPLLQFFLNYKVGALRTTECIEQCDVEVGQLDLKTYSAGFLLHYGDCEHRVILNSARLYDRTRDCPYVQCYPVSIFQPRERSIGCDICEYRCPTKAVFNTPLLPHIPSHLCDPCYEKFEKESENTGIYKSNGLPDKCAINIEQV